MSLTTDGAARHLDEDLDQLDQLDDLERLERLDLGPTPDWPDEDPDEAAELDRRAWGHIARLVAEFDPDDPRNDEPFGDDPGPVDLEVDDQVAPFMPDPAGAPGPLVGSLAQLAFRWGVPEAPGASRSPSRRAGREDPGDVPGWGSRR